MAFVTILGIGGGIYIYKPYFEAKPKASVQQNEHVSKKQNETDTTS